MWQQCDQQQNSSSENNGGNHDNVQNSHGFINVLNGDNVNVLSGNFSQGFTGGNSFGGEHTNILGL
jgi:hypothetical protein